MREISQALADAILGLAVADDRLMDLQAVPFMLINPTPPAVDVFPADPSQEVAAFRTGEAGPPNQRTFWTVRARVSTADDESGQEMLIALMEPAGATSLSDAIEYSEDVKEVTDAVEVNGPSGFRLYQSAAPSTDLEHAGVLLGVEWQVLAYTKTDPTS